jgi:hypothetical protein
MPSLILKHIDAYIYRFCYRLSVASVTNSNETKSREMNMEQFSASWVLENMGRACLQEYTAKGHTQKTWGEKKSKGVRKTAI